MKEVKEPPLARQAYTFIAGILISDGFEDQSNTPKTITYERRFEDVSWHPGDLIESWRSRGYYNDDRMSTVWYPPHRILKAWFKILKIR